VVLPPHRFVPPHLVIEIIKYEAEMVSDGITLIPHFMKIGQMFPKSKGTDTERERDSMF
jgi:hypothetical protein